MNQLSLARAVLFVALVAAGASGAFASDRFTVSVGSHDMLVVSAPNGDRKAELPLPTISQDVTIDGAVCQISYGRDADNLLTAVVAPSPAQPQALHFTVLGKAVDADKSARVTLIFSKTLKSVQIDPGYVGEVQVDSHRLNHDAAVNHMPHRAVTSAVAAATTTEADTAPAPIPTPVAEPNPPVAANQPANLLTPAGAIDGIVSDHAPLPSEVNDASQMPFTATATPGPSTVSVRGPETAPKQHTLYWAEPITPPSGRAPSVASTEMKLIEVSGQVSVTLPGGTRHDGASGMLLPSGTIVSTSGGGSAAVFMGGVNSVRLMPDSEVQLTQQVTGSTRKTVVTLREGTVFSRVGHRDGETQSYAVVTPQGTAMAKGTEFADTLTNGHHYVFVVKGIVATIINGIQTGLLTPTSTDLASGAMPAANDGDKVLFAVLTALQPFQTQLQKVIADINNGTATPAEIGYFDSLRKTFSVLVDDVYDPTHPNAFLGAFTSTTGYGDSFHSSLERPQDFGTPNPLNSFNGFQEGAARPFFTPAVTPSNMQQTPTPISDQHDPIPE